MVFDLGGVLIDWDPRHLYRKLFAGDEVAMEAFLATICTAEWNRSQDAGRSFAEGAKLLKAEHPDEAELIDAYGARFDEMMAGPIVGAVEVLAELRERGAPLYGLSNFSAETFPPAFERFEFLRWLRGIVVSGEVGVIKPDQRIYEIALERFAIDPHCAVYIDDVPINVAAAASPPCSNWSFATIRRRIGLIAVMYTACSDTGTNCVLLFLTRSVGHDRRRCGSRQAAARVITDA